jgi:hypothetical protein
MAKPHKPDSRVRYLRTALRDITTEELRRELQRRKESDFTADIFSEIGDMDLQLEYEYRDLGKYYRMPSFGLDMLRYGLEDADWRKVREAYQLLQE